MLEILKTIFYQPLYNGLIAMIDIIPWVDAGVAVILFTILIKLILFPLSKKAVRTQLAMKKLQPQIEEIKKKFKDDKQAQAQAMMSLYKKEKVNPLSGILVIFIQIPIIFSLYYIFLRGGLPVVNMDLLYSFIPKPENINVMFLGLIDITSRSIPLALAAGISAFFQLRYSVPPYKRKENPGVSLKDDLAKSMNIQMRYVFPIIVFFIAYGISAAIALYWTTSNLFTLGQELYIRKKIFKNDQSGNTTTDSKSTS